MIRLIITVPAIAWMLTGYLLVKPFDIELTTIRSMVEYVTGGRNPTRARAGVALVNGGLWTLAVAGIVSAMSELLSDLGWY